MSSEDVLAYLIERQEREGISGMAMAQRLGMSETNWSHARRGRRGLTVKQIERAIEHYPELASRLGQPSQAAS
jgi:DNA-binding transcriptional regulator YdaS (Cro superfamily)